MKKAKKITLAAILAALGVTLMYLGAFIQVLDLSVVAIASVLVIFARIELGSPYDWLTYAVTGILSAIMIGSVNFVIPVLYLSFAGIYPILKAYFEHLRRPIAYLVKGAYFAVASLLLVLGAYLLSEFVLGVPLLSPALAGYTAVILIALYVLIFLMCFVYDLLLSHLVVIYMLKIRPKIASVLK